MTNSISAIIKIYNYNNTKSQQLIQYTVAECRHAAQITYNKANLVQAYIDIQAIVLV